MRGNNNYQLKKLILVFLTLIGIYIITFLLDNDSDYITYMNLSFSKKMINFLLNLLFCYVTIELILFIDKRMNLIIPWIKYPLRRLVLQTIIQAGTVFILLLLFGIIITVFFIVSGLDIKDLNDSNVAFWPFVLAFIILVLILGGVNTVNYLSSNWKRAVEIAAEYRISAAESKQLLAETELEALRLQLDPHFVFNNLSVLSEFILKDQRLGFDYTENFAKVYRYLLTNSKNKVVPLKEEVQFLDAYLFLLKHRMGAGVVFEVTISSAKMNLKIPPITLQLLVENSIKHNRIEKENPLIVKIFTTEENELVVQNNILPLLKSPLSFGIGLENITNRYALLSERRPQIEYDNNIFTVKIPLFL